MTAIMDVVIRLVVYLALTGALIAVSRPIRRMPRRHYPMLAVVWLMALAQAIAAPRLTFPFVSWDMYTVRRPPRVFYTFWLVQGAERTEYPFRVLLPFVPGPLDGFSLIGPVQWRLIEMRTACACDQGDRRLDQAIESLAGIATRMNGRLAEAFEIRTGGVSATHSERSRDRLLYRWMQAIAR